MNKGLLRNGPLRALLVAEVISTTGSQMTWLALPWFVLTTSGSATRMSVLMLTWTILQPLGLFTAGPVLDRFGVEPVLIAFAAIQTLMMSAVALACLWVRPRAASSALPAGSTS